MTDWSNLNWLMHQWISKVQTSSYGNAAVISDKVMIVRQTTNGPYHSQTTFFFNITDYNTNLCRFSLNRSLFIKATSLHRRTSCLKHKKIAQKLKMDNTEDFTVFSKYVILKSAWWESCSKKKMQSKQCIKGNKTTGNLISSSNLNCTFVLHH